MNTTSQIKNDFLMIKGIEEQFLKHCSNLIKDNSLNKPLINAIKKSQKKYFNAKHIIQKAYLNKQTYRHILDLNHKKHRHLPHCKAFLKKSTFYTYLKQLRDIWYFANDKLKWNPINSVFKNLILETTVPNNPNRKYTIEQEKAIADFYYNSDVYVINKTNIWLSLRFNDKEFNNLSLATVCTYIKRDKRSLKLPPRSKISHPLRKWNIDIGNIQLDVKVIGRGKNKWHRNIYIMDAKDEQSKLYWAKVLKYQTKSELLTGLKEAIDFFKGYGIPIKRIRTDNAMVFKKTNFVQTGEFDRLLEEHQIIHEFIPLKQPECNGVIERHHKILDEEFVCNLYKCETLDQIENHLLKFQDYYNNQRYGLYNFKTDCHYLEKYDIPIRFLQKYLPLQLIRKH